MEACERGHASVAAVRWRELRFDDGDARTRGAAARSRADARAVKCVEGLPVDAPVSTYVAWVFGEVAPSLAGGALGRLAAWAATRARALEADGRLDDALLIAREAHDSIGDRCGAGAVACGNDGDAWLADSDAADAQSAPYIAPSWATCGNTSAGGGRWKTRSAGPSSAVTQCLAKAVAVDEEKLELTVQGLDLLDGTPVLDVKPYVPYCDAFPDARAGWVDELDENDS